MKEEYIVMDCAHCYTYDIHTLKTAKGVAENYTLIDGAEHVVLKVVGRVSPPGKVVWNPDFEE